jgi:hypothetical protein
LGSMVCTLVFSVMARMSFYFEPVVVQICCWKGCEGVDCLYLSKGASFARMDSLLNSRESERSFFPGPSHVPLIRPSTPSMGCNCSPPNPVASIEKGL